MSTEDERKGDEPTGSLRGGRRDPSDMFQVRASVRKAIPRIERVPLTREEVRRRRVVRATLAALALAAVAAAILFAIHLRHRRAIDERVAIAEREGRIGAIDDALRELEGEGSSADGALRARLEAMAALAGEPARRERAEALLREHPIGEDNASDHRIASTYLAIAAGDPELARTHASALVPGRGPRAAEAGHARALAALAIGNVEAAREAADAALADAPDAPRHQALVLEIGSRETRALELTEGDATVLRIARARARWERDLGRDEALADARAVLEASDATPAERGWAELLGALAKVAQGDTVGATQALSRAEESRPPGDELFDIEVAEAWLALARLDAADRTIARLGTGVSTDAGRRGLLYARRALAHDDAETAERMAALAPPSPRRALVEAEIAALRGDVDRAVARYEAALESPDLAVEARCGLSELYIGRGRAAEALAPIEPLLARDPTFPRVAAAAAYALAANGERARALQLVDEALATHPREPMLLKARGRVFVAGGAWPEALEAYRAAMEVDDHDVEVARDRGVAAWRVAASRPSDAALLEEARRSFARALELVPTDRETLLLALTLANDTGDVEGGRAALESIDRASYSSHELERQRARHLVLALAGARGVAAVRAACEHYDDDAELRVRLGQLQYQAERWNDAADAFYSASLRASSERRYALAMRALSFGRARRTPSVEPAIDMLRVGTAADPLAPREEALAALASAWSEWHEQAYGRASILARQALARDPGNDEVELLLAYADARERREPTERMRAASASSLEALGWLATHEAAIAAASERCDALRRYLAGAPEGRYAADARRALSSCPSG